MSDTYYFKQHNTGDTDMAERYDYKEVGARIRMLRGKNRQKDWANKIGCDQGYISQVENGVTKPSLAFLGAVSSMTSACRDWVLSGRGSRLLSTNAGVGEGSAAGSPGTITSDYELINSVEGMLHSYSKARALIISLGEMSEDRLKGLGELLGVDNR